MSKKLKISFQDDQGNKYFVEVQGDIENNKIQKILEIYQTLNSSNTTVQNNQANSLYQRLLSIIQSTFPDRPFTSSDIQEYYEDIYKEPIKLAAVSTYLSRFNIHGLLNRRKHGRTWMYSLVISQNMPQIVKSQHYVD